MGVSRTLVSTVFSGLVVVFVFSLILSGLLGQPVLVGYVETDSMSPTLDPGDGFVAIPTELSGEIRENDVIVFEAENLHGGGLVTHRVVGTTESGYVTKGDANPIADQSGGEPFVREEQVVAKALQLDGWLVVIPNLGMFVESVQGGIEEIQLRLAGVFHTRLFLGARGLAMIFSATLLVAYTGLIIRERSGRPDKEYTRNSTRSDGMSGRFLVFSFALMLITATTLGMVLPSTTHAPELRTSNSETITLHVNNGGLVPVVVFIEPSDEVTTVDPQRLYVPSQSSKEATVVLPPPENDNDVRRFIHERRYVAFLPAPLLTALHRHHPWVAIVALDALVAVPFYLLGISLIGNGQIRLRSRSRGLSPFARVRRVVRSLYSDAEDGTGRG